MATLDSIMTALKSKGSEKTRVTYARHGTPIDRTLGVSVADLKLVAKTIKGDQALALELYDTGIMDAMYLAGMVADGSRMTVKQLQAWADGADGMTMISDHTVPWVAVESAHARELAMKWIASKKELVAASGWRTWSGIVAITPDDALDLAQIEELMKTIVARIHTAPNRVRSTMNSFVISVGIYVPSLSKQARDAAQTIGAVSVDMGDTACKTPLAIEYIAKAAAAGRVGIKRKTIRC
jgi:3-methyladenine DNA glycosylase AlkD